MLAAAPGDFARAQGGDRNQHQQNKHNEGSAQKPQDRDRDAERPRSKEAGDIDREKLKQELMSLSPEERQQRIKKIREKHRGKMEQGKQKFEQRWQNATSEERTQLCVKLQQRCTQGGKKYACRAHNAKCN